MAGLARFGDKRGKSLLKRGWYKVGIKRDMGKNR
jgi:hypothetical protein